MSHVTEALQRLLEGVDLTLFVLDRTGRFTDFVAGHMKLEAPPTVFLGKHLRDIFTGPLAEQFAAALEGTLRGERHRVTYALGDRHFVAHLAPTHDGAAVLVTDVTAEVVARTGLEQSERRFKTLIENASDVLYVVTRDFQVTFWSPGATRALGWTAADAVGKNGADFIHPEDLPRLKQPGGPRVRYRVRHKNGTWRWLDATAHDLHDDPAIAGLVVNARDVTDEQVLALRSAEAQKLESIGRLAGGIAHDFNNLLTVILSCGELLQGALDAGRPPLPADISEILTAGNRARDLTQQLLAFARRQVFSPRVVDVSAMVCDAERLLRRVLGEDVTLALQVDPRPCLTKVDPSQLEQVLLNLAVNARDAMASGGKLHLSTELVELEPARAASLGLPPGPTVRLRVRDEGAALSPEARQRLFEPFFRVHGQANGLGLATVYGIVNQSGGAITVDSEEGRGTTFDVFLLRAQDTAPVVDAAARRATGRAVVLLVEDDPGVGGVNERVLNDAGYRVVRAHHGLEAVSLAQREPHLDLLLTDIVMPGLDGRKVAEAVQKVHPGVRVLFVSGYAVDDLVQRGIERGVQFLPKPFTPSKLRARVAEVLG